ncbi:glycoside hydrolase family 19 protein [Schauerella aestuarii]|uniref:glycoside hydrolase family 19 protein n=1 Tax=Schauerella aestuarii TaxID=2511204 RepID=UPI0013705783|nr:glycoside hydrolase family 19 protein [Achromobacter aestuarii]MYZ44229.1 hypothetical protein [Achromobacter aestuarii]
MRKDDFAAATGLSSGQADKWYDPVERAMMEFAIVSPQRAAMFLATIGHETMGYTRLSEIWGPTDAQKRYDNRADLGNTRPEAIRIAAAHGSTPGSWWRGYGGIQITGYDNHRATGEALGYDLLNDPQQLTEPVKGMRSAGRWWKTNGCNEIADTGDFFRLSIRVNGKNRDGLPNGWADRQRRYKAAIAVLG